MKTCPKWAVKTSQDLLYTESFIPAFFSKRPYLGNETRFCKCVRGGVSVKIADFETFSAFLVLFWAILGPPWVPEWPQADPT